MPKVVIVVVAIAIAVFRHFTGSFSFFTLIISTFAEYTYKEYKIEILLYLSTSIDSRHIDLESNFMAAEQQNYNLFQTLVHVVQGTKICEGNIWEKLIFDVIRDTGIYTSVTNGESIPLNGGGGGGAAKTKGARKKHKVDIFCKDDEKKIIQAYNSKGKSFNNTESPESLLQEYQRYKTAIETAYPGYTVTYNILKDEFDCKNGKMSKYNYLQSNGIPVYNTALYLKERYGISTEYIEMKRQKKVIEILQSRFKETGLTIEQLVSLF